MDRTDTDAPLAASPATTKATYDADANTIVLRAGSQATLATVGQVLERPAALRELAPGEWLLSANLLVEPGAALWIGAPEVRWLKLRSDTGGFVWIKALGGTLTFANTCVTSWDAAQNDVDTQYADGRSFVLARDGARMVIRDSALSYLGYDADESYGVAWRLAGTSGAAINSRFGHNFYGLYSYAVDGLVVRGSEVHHSVRYGIDPHTRSNRLLIEGNRAHHNGKHGIILAERCSNSVIRGNVVFNNTLHGIVLYQDSNHNLVEGNTSYGNGQQGINVNASSDNTIRSNTVYDNAGAGIGVGQGASANRIVGNHVRANREDGIVLYSAARDNVLRNNTVSDNARYGIYLKSAGNTIAGGHHVFGNLVGVYLNVEQPPQISRTANRIYGNREADVRQR
jgi:parallel beta-helix repeat protein